MDFKAFDRSKYAGEYFAIRLIRTGAGTVTAICLLLRCFH